MQNQMSGNDDKDKNADVVIDDDKDTTTSKMFWADSKFGLR